MLLVLLTANVLGMKLYYVPIKHGQNDVEPIEFKREFLQNEKISKPNANVTVATTQIEGYKLNKLSKLKYSSAKQLFSFEITCAEENLVEDFEGQYVEVGSSEYRFAECAICITCNLGNSCEDPRFYCAEHHVFCKCCLEEYEKHAYFDCPICHGKYAGFELSRLGKVAHSYAGKAMQIIIEISFWFCALQLCPRADNPGAEIGLLFFLYSLKFFRIKILLPLLNLIQPHDASFKLSLLFFVYVNIFAAYLGMLYEIIILKIS